MDNASMPSNQGLQNRGPLKIIISFQYSKQSSPEVPKDAFSHILHERLCISIIIKESMDLLDLNVVFLGMGVDGC